MLLVVACKETEEQRIAKHIKYWENKEIVFPKDYSFTVYGKDTIDFPWESAEHKILVYVDSTNSVQNLFLADVVYISYIGVLNSCLTRL